MSLEYCCFRGGHYPISMTPIDTRDDDPRAREGTPDPAAAVGSSAPVEPNRDALAACQEEVQELKAENADLRESAESFGALAERLNRAKHSQT
jgi:hypothetical protein